MQHSSSHNEHQQLIDSYVCTYEGEDWRHITEEMIDNVGAAKGKSESSCSVSHGVEETNSIGSHHQLYAESLGHGHRVQQWVTDGHIAVIGHGCQEKALGGQKNPKEPLLQGTAHKRDDFSFCKGIREHLGAHN